MNIVITIIPIFVVIMLGWLARRHGFMPPEFLGHANRLVYYFAIPAMIFSAVSKGSLYTQLNITVLAITLISMLSAFAIAWGAVLLFRVRAPLSGSFIQGAVHGNLGYIGLAVAFYFLGHEGLARAGMVAGFMMILQNLFAVVALQVYSDQALGRSGLMRLGMKILGNPVIVAALAGIVFSMTRAAMPEVIDRVLKILSGMALPMALLVIGASLSFKLVRLKILPVIGASLIKLVLMPLTGFVLFRMSGAGLPDYLPALILMASPTATLTYVMGREMQGDCDFAVAAISMSTLLSGLTFLFWLYITA
ncbi:MAG: AEC family transporter [Deltaproteobacteria bacterium]|nr:AEC family transporter [Deltaproteobacteria bacterium]